MCLNGEEPTGSTLAVLLQDEITQRTNSLVGIPPSCPAPEVPATDVSAVSDVPPGREGRRGGDPATLRHNGHFFCFVFIMALPAYRRDK